MPEEEYVWLPREDILQFEEIERLVDQFLFLGVDKVRLTGGEPLLRRDLPSLVERLSRKDTIRDLAMTTNAVLLAPAVQDLKRAGLHRLTISLDTLQRDRFVKLARFDELPRVLAGIDAAVDVFPGFKIDTVMIRGVNDDEMIPLLEFAKARGAELRFIEYMDVGGANELVDDAGRLARRHAGDDRGALRRDRAAAREQSSAPADRYRLADGTHVRDHRVDHRTLLPLLRSQSPDRRRRLVSVPLRRARRRSARSVARRRERRSVARSDHERVARANGSRRGEPPRRPRAIAADSAQGAEGEIRISKCTHAEAERSQSAVESRQLRAFSWQLTVQFSVRQFLDRPSSLLPVVSPCS